MPKLLHRDKKVILRIWVDPSTDKAMRRIAYREGMPLAQYVREALERDIAQIYALGFLGLVRYEVVEEQDQTGMVLHVTQDNRGTRFAEWGFDVAGDGVSS